ncbi:MAG: tetratricopeptide repeat protein [Polyangiaceae bacterium]|nr:tetratricopeptide repeat protein [Polyangiaceae bacterium]
MALEVQDENAFNYLRLSYEAKKNQTRLARTLRELAVRRGEYDLAEGISGELKDALGYYDLLLQQADQKKDGALALRAAAWAQGHLSEATLEERAIQVAKTIAPTDSEVLAAWFDWCQRKGSVEERVEALRLRAASSGSNKIEDLRKAAELSLSLRNPQEAIRSSGELLLASSGEEGADTIERLARETGAYDECLRLFRQVIGQETTSPKTRKALRTRTAGLLTEGVGDVRDAVALYRSELEEEYDPAVVEKLEPLVRSSNDPELIRWFFSKRIDSANTKFKIDLLQEWATIEEEIFAAPDRASDLYRKILEILPGHGPALRALGKALSASGQYEEAIAILERDIEGKSGREKRDRILEKAQLERQRLNAPEKAMATLATAASELSDDEVAQHAAEWEPLLDAPALREAVAKELVGFYTRQGKSRERALMLEIVLAVAKAKEDKRALHLDLIAAYEQEKDEDRLFNAFSRALREFPDELQAWEAAFRFSTDGKKVREVLKIAKELQPPTGAGDSDVRFAVARWAFERASAAGDLELSIAYAECVLASDPKHEGAFSKAKQLYSSFERWADLERLYERALEAETDVARRRSLLRDLMLVTEEMRQDKAASLHAARRLLEIDPNDRDAQFQAERLAENLGDLPVLVQVLRNRSGAFATDALERLAEAEWKTGDAVAAVETLKRFVAERGPSTHTEALFRTIASENREEPGLEAARSLVSAVSSDPARAREHLRALELLLGQVHGDERLQVLRERTKLAVGLGDATAKTSLEELLQEVPNDAGLIDTYWALEGFPTQEQAAFLDRLTTSKETNDDTRRQLLLRLVQFHDRSQHDRSQADAARYERRVLDEPSLTGEARRNVLRSLSERERTMGETKLLSATLELYLHEELELAERLRALELLGQSYVSLGEAEAAIRTFEDLHALDSANVTAVRALDALYEKQGEFEKLVTHSHLVEAIAESAEQRRTIVLRDVSVLVNKLDRKEDAAERLMEAEAHGFSDSSLRHQLATLQEELGQFEPLLATLGKLRETSDAAATAKLFVRSGNAALKASHNEEGVGYFEEAYVRGEEADARVGLLQVLRSDDSARFRAARFLRTRQGVEPTLWKEAVECEWSDPSTSEPQKEELAETVFRLAESSDPAFAAELSARALLVAPPERTEAWVQRVRAVAPPEFDMGARFAKAATDLVESEAKYIALLAAADAFRSTKRIAEEETALSDAAELFPQRARAYEERERLFDVSESWEKLTELYRRWIEVADATLQTSLRWKLARTFETKRSMLAECTDVVEDLHRDTPSLESFSELERLYGKTERFEDLVALRETELESPRGSDRKAELLVRNASTLDTMGQRERALDCLERSISIDPAFAPARELLQRMRREDSLTLRASRVLESAYERTSEKAELVEIVRWQIDHSGDPEEKREKLGKLAHLKEERGDLSGALDALGEKLILDPRDVMIQQEIERISNRANDRTHAARAYAAAVDATPEMEIEIADLCRRAGRVFEETNHTEEALKYFQRAFDWMPDEDAEGFTAIDRLLEKRGEREARVAHRRRQLLWLEDAGERVRALLTLVDLERALSRHEQIVEDCRAVLDLDGAQSQTRGHLVEALEALERGDELVEALRAWIENSPTDDLRDPLRVRLAKHLEKRGEIELALEEYRLVLETVSEGEAERVAESAVDAYTSNPEWDESAYGILKDYFARTGQWRKTVETNDRWLKSVDSEERRATLLRENAFLLDTRAGVPAEAYRAYTAAFLADPTDGDALGSVLRLGRAANAWDDLATTLEQAATKVEGIDAREILTELATIHDTRRDDPRLALATWRKISDLEPTDEVALGQMESLSTLLSDWRMLDVVLCRRAELLATNEERASMFRRVGEARRDMLDEPRGAVEAYERAAEYEPENTRGIDCLIELYQSLGAKEDTDRFLALIDKRVELHDVSEGQEKLELLMLAGERNAKEGEHARAREYFESASDLGIDRLRPLRAIEGVVRSTNDEEGLVEILRELVGVETDAPKKRSYAIELTTRLFEKSSTKAEAVDRWRALLQEEYEESGFRSLLAHAAAESDVLLLEEILRVAEKAGKTTAVVDALSARIELALDDRERSRLLEQKGQVLESQENEHERAFATYLSVLEFGAGTEGAHAALERLSNAVDEARSVQEPWKMYADACAARAEDEVDVRVFVGLYRRAAIIAQGRLHDPERAGTILERCLERGGDDLEMLLTLERLYGSLSDTNKRERSIERQIALLSDTSEIAKRWKDIAELRMGRSEPSQAIDALRAALLRNPGDEGVLTLLETWITAELDVTKEIFRDGFPLLEDEYVRKGDLHGRVRIQTVRAERVVEKDRAENVSVLGHLYEDLGELPKAQREYEKVVRREVEREYVRALENAANRTGEWPSAREALHEGISNGAVGIAVAEAWRALARWSGFAPEDRALAETSWKKVAELDGDPNDALQNIERILRQSERTDELRLILLRLGKVDQGAAQDAYFREAYTLAKGSAEEESTLRSVLREAPRSEWALEQLQKIAMAAGNSTEALDLLSRRIELAPNDLTIRITLAEVHTQRKELESAAEVYDSVLEQDPGHLMALEALRSIYGQVGNKRAWASLLERLQEGETDQEKKIVRAREIASVRLELGQRELAAQQYRAILQLRPSDQESLLALISVLRALDDTAGIIEALEDAVRAGAPERADAWRTELVGLYEKRGEHSLALPHVEALLMHPQPSAEILIAAARTFEQLALNEKALACFTRLAAQDESNRVSWLQKGLDAAKRMSLPTAEEEFLRALVAAGAGAKSMDELIKLLERGSRWEDVLRLYEEQIAFLETRNAEALTNARAKRAEPPRASMLPPMASVPPAPMLDEPVSRVVLYLQRASVTADQKLSNRRKAIELLSRAVELAPLDRNQLRQLVDLHEQENDSQAVLATLDQWAATFGTMRSKELATVQHRRGKLYLAIGEMQKALEAFEAAFVVDPASVEILRDLGTCALELRDYDRAQKTYRALLLQKTEDVGLPKSEVFFKLGEISQAQGDKAKAIQMFERALEHDPSNERARTRIAELR